MCKSNNGWSTRNSSSMSLVLMMILLIMCTLHSPGEASFFVSKNSHFDYRLYKKKGSIGSSSSWKSQNIPSSFIAENTVLSLAPENRYSENEEESNKNQPLEVLLLPTTTTNRNSSSATALAQQLLEQSRALYEEAARMEQEMKEQRLQKQQRKQQNIQWQIQQIFENYRNNATFSILCKPHSVAQKIQHMSSDQLCRILEALYEQQQQSPLQKEEESYINCLLQATQYLENNTTSTSHERTAIQLQSRYNELRRTTEIQRQQQMEIQIQRALSTSKDHHHHQQQHNTTSKRMMEQRPVIPYWIPSALIPYMTLPLTHDTSATTGSSTTTDAAATINTTDTLLSTTDIQTIKDRVLIQGPFYCTSSESHLPYAAIFRGNVRNSASTSTGVLETIQGKLEDEGLNERVQLFFLQDPTWRPTREDARHDHPPVLLALPAKATPSTNHQPKPNALKAFLKATSWPMSLLTTYLFSTSCYALNTKFFQGIVASSDAYKLTIPVPIMTGILLLHGSNEMIRRLVARHKGIRLGRFFPVPSGHMGLFGGVSSLRSIPPNRTSLFDMSMAGLVSSTVTALLIMVLGIQWTNRASLSRILDFPVVPVALLKSSMISGTLLTYIAPKTMSLPLSQPVAIHPMFLVGYMYLVSASLNALPVFRLDGGRACSAVMGSRFHAIASASTLLFMASVILPSSTGLGIAWLITLLAFHRQSDLPCRDGITTIGRGRFFVWISSLCIALLTLIPFPRGSSLL